MPTTPHTDELMVSMLATAIGKALIKKGLLTCDEIAEELDLFRSAGGGAVNEQLNGTIDRLISAVLRW